MQRPMTTDGDTAARLRQAVVPLARQLRQRSIGSFTPTQLSVLGSINRYGPLPLGDLAEREGLSAASISKAVAVLEDAKAVERVPAPNDRRVCLVQVSVEGTAWIDANRQHRDEWLSARMRGLSAADRAAVEAAIPALERLIAHHGRG